MKQERRELLQSGVEIKPETFGRRLARAAGRTADVGFRIAIAATLLALTFGPLPISK